MSEEMKWPERPTCHAIDPVFKMSKQIVWRPPEMNSEPYGYPFRSCSYCGCIHPEDLLKFLKEGAMLGGSDWKYGWPHKFYVEGIPNPQAGKQVCIGGTSRRDEKTGEYVEESIMGQASPTTTAKWYNEHLKDIGYSPEAWKALVEALKDKAGITFEMDERGLKYKAPHHGFQHDFHGSNKAP